MRSCLMIFGFLLLVLSPSSQAQTLYEKYASLPIMENLSISPDGNKLAAIYNAADGPQVVLMDFPSVEFTPLVQLKKARDRIEYVVWSGNRYLIVALSYPEYSSGDYFRINRLYRIDLKTKEAKELTDKRFSKKDYYRYVNFRLVSALKDDPEHILVSAYDELDRGISVYRVNLADSDFDKIIVNNYKIDSWYADNHGVVRLGLQWEKDKSTDEHKLTTWYRNADGESMKALHTVIIGKSETFEVMGLSEDGNKAYVMSDRINKRESLWLYDIQNNQFEREVYSNPEYDLAGALTNNEGELSGVFYYDDYQRQHYFSDNGEQQTALIKKLLPEMESFVVASSRDKQRFVVQAESTTQIPVYFYVDLRNKKAGVWLSKYPLLNHEKLSEPKNIYFKASDGMALRGYLTMPDNVQNPPLIVFPHGGPHARDYKYFDPFVQFFAAKGYAVLQVNFRGSEGFGNPYETAGYYEWGKRMQRDVDDAMDYVLTHFPVAKDKACMVGASYGGYVALTEAFQQPTRYKCYVSIAGISDLQADIAHEKKMQLYVGNIIKEETSAELAALGDVSAINHISKITAPILLIHGTKDTQVNYHQSADFYDKARGKIDVQYIELEDTTHYLDDSAGRKATFKALDEFLSKYL